MVGSSRLQTTIVRMELIARKPKTEHGHFRKRVFAVKGIYSA